MNSYIDSFFTNEKTTYIYHYIRYTCFCYFSFHHMHKITNTIIMQPTVYPYLFNSDKD